MTADDKPGERVGEIGMFIARIRAGDEEAARELLRRYEDKVRLVVRRQLPKLLRSRFDSLDFLQSVWGSFFHRVRTGPTDIEDEPNLVAFLAWAARNKVFDEYRRASSKKHDVRREESLSDGKDGSRDLPAAVETASQAAQARETLERLRELVPEDRRRVLELKIEGYSCREIGARLGLSERTVQRVIEDLRSRARVDAE
ncbi:MAG TPA: sigma-70 family RNA polymerase sigma factor [Isosphaeraceae bacterium]|nr:sigma-70 family RNA polymerase sigma factor [Isosphaeraceae bacterium]